MTSIINNYSSGIFLNSKAKTVDPQSREKAIDDSIGNNPGNAIDFIDDLGERITLSKKVFMGIINSIYKLDPSMSKQDFVNLIDREGVLSDGLTHPIKRGELLSYMNNHEEVSSINNDSDSGFNSLQKLGVKLTKEELLELLKKSLEEKSTNLQALQKNINIDTKTLFEYKNNRQDNFKEERNILQELLVE